MEQKLKSQLERFGRIETDYRTWVHPWETYWHLYCKSHHDLLIKILSLMYPDYHFSRGECHICNHIYQVINISKNSL